MTLVQDLSFNGLELLAVELILRLVVRVTDNGASYQRSRTLTVDVKRGSQTTIVILTHRLFEEDSALWQAILTHPQ